MMIALLPLVLASTPAMTADIAPPPIAVDLAAMNDPSGIPMAVRRNGELTEWTIQFESDGTWQLWDGAGEVLGFGIWEYDAQNEEIHYENLSGDGGGNQTGTYSWNTSTGEWDRSQASHPNAPKMSLIPPL